MIIRRIVQGVVFFLILGNVALPYADEVQVNDEEQTHQELDTVVVTAKRIPAEKKQQRVSPEI